MAARPQHPRNRADVVHAYLLAPNIASVFLEPFLPGTQVAWGVRASNMSFGHYGRRSSPSSALDVGSGAPCGARLSAPPDGGHPQRHRSRTLSPNAAARRAIRAEWGVPDTDRLLGLVGRLDPMKDHATFLQTARIVAAERTDVRFACVGHGPAAAGGALELLTAELGHMASRSRAPCITGTPRCAAITRSWRWRPGPATF